MENPELLHPLSSAAAVPGVFPSPFSTGICDLALDAARSLQARLPHMCHHLHDFDHADGGKMIGVLVVETSARRLAYLSAFSGMLGGRWQCAGFVPPVFDLLPRQCFLTDGEARLAALKAELENIKSCSGYKTARQNFKLLQDQCTQELSDSRASNKTRQQQRDVKRTGTDFNAQMLIAESREDKRRHRELKADWHNRLAISSADIDSYKIRLDSLAGHRRELSRQLQKQIFDGYMVKSFTDDIKSLSQLFGDKTPPGGAGDCAAVKLFNYCIEHQLKPLCLAEFWWGASPASGVRRHGGYYPSCRGKCGVILPFMLRGVVTASPGHEILPDFSADQPAIVFEDNELIVVNKPAGMLSVPGKISHDSVESRLRMQYPQTCNANLLVHRLDQATSGLLIAAKTKEAHRNLQQQFEQRKIEKHYCAILSAALPNSVGTIDLPLRVDIDDRPRQLVCYEHGKYALTRYHVIEKTTATTRVQFTPLTGRTHQLRLHAAHQRGLNAPIVGDELYGVAADRLYLHAQTLVFSHPASGKRLEFNLPAPF